MRSVYMGAHSIFSREEQIQGCTFSSKKVDDPFLLVTLKTQIFTVNYETNAQYTLQHFQGQVPPCPCLPAPIPAFSNSAL